MTEGKKGLFIQGRTRFWLIGSDLITMIRHANFNISTCDRNDYLMGRLAPQGTYNLSINVYTTRMVLTETTLLCEEGLYIGGY